MKVLLFARLRDVFGADSVELDDVATIGQLRRSLMTTYPRAMSLVEKCAFAINDEFADDNAAIPRGAEVALLPPVSGG